MGPKPYRVHPGDRLGMLTVIRWSHTIKSSRTLVWMCRCDCGTEKLISQHSFTRKNRNTVSCGCYGRKLREGPLRNELHYLKHGHARKDRHTPEHRAWVAMKHRCLYPACNHYQSYGGRGISVCDRWLNSFENFLADMGRKPSPTHSLDRIVGIPNPISAVFGSAALWSGCACPACR